MSKIKYIYLSFFLYTLTYSQGTMNGYGIGNLSSQNGSQNATNGLIELAPSFQKGISLSNPTTWKNLKFTYLSVSYAYDRVNSTNSSILNDYSNISNISWIVPLKSKTSLGITLSPYSHQKIDVISKDTLIFSAFGDTIKTSNNIRRFGGIMSFKIGGSRQITNKLNFGTIINFLFGSSRYDELIHFQSSPSVMINTRHRYTGLFNSLYIDYTLNDKLKLFGKYSYPIKPLNIAILDRPIFEDTNENQYHDYSAPLDFPHPDSLNTSEEKRVKEVHKPVGTTMAFQYKVNSRSYISMEVSQFNDSGDYKLIKTPLNNYVIKQNLQSLQYTHFNDDLSLRPIDKFISRIGFQTKKILLEKNQIEINENCLSVGIGFKFKKMGNQIDFNYVIGKRVYRGLQNNEKFQQFQFSTSLADIWFVKRRQK